MNTFPFSILIVDDTQQNVQVLSQMLRDVGYKVFAAFNGPDALNLVSKRLPDLILLDVMMPEMNGFDVCHKLKSDERTAEIPIIFLSALSDVEAKINAFEAGGVDYITKPFQQQEVLARINLHLELKSLERDRVKYINELKINQERLEHLNKEKDDVLAIISHDMRNPLGGIIGISNLLRTESVSDPEELHEMLKLIESSAEKLLDLVNDLLDIAVIEANSFVVEYHETSISDLIKDVIQLHYPAAKSKQIHLSTNNPDEPVLLQVDYSKISQVIGNLISNAIKFTQPDGTIRVENELFDHNNVPSVKITISDTGIGIPEESMPVLFNKMGGHQRSGTSGEKGTGLGMPLVKRYVEVHKGEILVESKINEGTTFTILLPLNP